MLGYMAKGNQVTDGIKVASQLTLRGEMILHFASMPNVITGVLISGRRRQRRERE